MNIALLLIVGALSSLPLQAHATQQSGRPSLQVKTETLWRPIPNPMPDNNQVIAVYCRVTIFSREPQRLNKLTLAWQPHSLDQGNRLQPRITTASLYEHKGRTPFHPTNQRYLTHGTWDMDKQTLTFAFGRPHKIVAKKTYYILIGCLPTSTQLISRSQKIYPDHSPLNGSLIYTDRFPLQATPLRSKKKAHEVVDS